MLRHRNPVGCSDQGISQLKLRSAVVKEDELPHCAQNFVGCSKCDAKEEKKQGCSWVLMETFIGKARTATVNSL